MAKFVVIIGLVLLVYCLVDCIQTDSSLIRNLAKPVWVVLIVLLPLIGGIAWLLAGRPERGPSTGQAAPWPSARPSGPPERGGPRAPKGPDDDPDFLRRLRERERRLREGKEPPDVPPGGPR